jgi:hypothetical protein
MRHMLVVRLRGFIPGGFRGDRDDAGKYSAAGASSKLG